ncbi:type VI secretion system baseplate subunit TssF [Motilimonas sp. 1_MG-2023]|uniref:type VI secretion system baseplate subunit TssF n=1 Tax=Motilimonas sp. 1_MG-2023 TaxID=3062672 RepID=UPI0026E1EFE0|nr:type VI secretion system baseplate subunit TssF [Motilimonas sp. 1_MG-2023]MDO6524579.1 type VI secretion system baseplate subunit TssF [Motilimonas sp. 1_MG-2023]
MSDTLLRYYERELAFVRRSLGQFAQQHPSHGEQLDINQGQINDPSLARLMDGVALLNAKTEQQISAQLPEVIDGLLSVLYPSYNQIIPSVAYLNLKADPAQLTQSVLLPAGSALAANAEGQECLFRTVADLTIHPISLNKVQAFSAPFNFERPEGAEKANAVIQLTLETTDEATLFSQLELPQLALFVQGFEQHADSLIELLLGKTLLISASDEQQLKHQQVPASKLVNRLTDSHFSFLHKTGNEFEGFQQLREFFSFKEKAQFFRLEDFNQLSQSVQSSTLVLNFFMSAIPAEFIRLFDNNVFKLNVIPAINLFSQRGEPIPYEHKTLSLPIMADAHHDSQVAIIDVERVFEIHAQGEKPLTPLFGEQYHQPNTTTYWQARHNALQQVELVISDTSPTKSTNKKIIGSQLLCSNGNLACSVTGAFECLENIDLPGELHLLQPPSSPILPELDTSLHWRFVGLLHSNFHSLLQSKQPTDSFKEMLTLCCRASQDGQRIETIKQVTFKPQVSSLRVMGQNIFAAGTEIEVTLDGSEHYLAFAHLLNGFLQQFCSFDRYIQLKIKLHGQDGAVKVFDKVHGSQLCF